MFQTLKNLVLDIILWYFPTWYTAMVVSAYMKPTKSKPVLKAMRFCTTEVMTPLMDYKSTR